VMRPSRADALRAIDPCGAAAFWRTFGPRRLRRQSHARLGCHPGWYRRLSLR
jgi:hypothetical protein